MTHPWDEFGISIPIEWLNFYGKFKCRYIYHTWMLWGCWWFWNPAITSGGCVEVGKVGLSHSLQGLIHIRWRRILAINRRGEPVCLLGCFIFELNRSYRYIEENHHSTKPRNWIGRYIYWWMFPFSSTKEAILILSTLSRGTKKAICLYTVYGYTGTIFCRAYDSKRNGGPFQSYLLIREWISMRKNDKFCHRHFL